MGSASLDGERRLFDNRLTGRERMAASPARPSLTWAESGLLVGVLSPATWPAPIAGPWGTWSDRVAPLALARMVPNRPDHRSMAALRRGETWAQSFPGPIALVWGMRDPILARSLRRHERGVPASAGHPDKGGSFPAGRGSGRAGSRSRGRGAAGGIRREGACSRRDRVGRGAPGSRGARLGWLRSGSVRRFSRPCCPSRYGRSARSAWNGPGSGRPGRRPDRCRCRGRARSSRSRRVSGLSPASGRRPGR